MFVPRLIKCDGATHHGRVRCRANGGRGRRHGGARAHVVCRPACWLTRAPDGAFRGVGTAPFVVLVVGCVASKCWSVPMRVTFYVMVLLIAAGSSMAYGYFALGTGRPRTAAFVLTPPISILAAGVILAVVRLFRSRSAVRSRP